MTKKLTIYEALVQKLGRTPTNEEIKADIERIKTEALVELAAKGKIMEFTKKYMRDSRTGNWISYLIVSINGEAVRVHKIDTEKQILSRRGE